MHKFLVLIIVFCLLNCNSKSNSVTKVESTEELSFDEEALIEFNKNLEKIRKQINEPVLDSLDYDSYRLFYLDSFQKHKIFRLNHHNENDNELIVKYFSSQGNDEDETYVAIVSEDKIKLTYEQYLDFQKLIKGSYFWSMNLTENPIPQYLDGYVFILEAIEQKSNYHEKRFQKVIRVVPYNGSFRQACEKLMEFYETSK